MGLRRIQLALLLVPGFCGAGADRSATPTVQWAASMPSPAAVAHGSDATVELSADVQQGWHVYALEQRPGGPTALQITLDDNNVAELAGVPTGTIPERRHDPRFDLETQFYSHSFVLRLPLRVKRPSAGRQLIPVSVLFQTCSDRECQPLRDSAIASGRVFRGGYGELCRQYLFKPVISVEHPSSSRGDRRSSGT